MLLFLQHATFLLLYRGFFQLLFFLFLLFTSSLSASQFLCRIFSVSVPLFRSTKVFFSRVRLLGRIRTQPVASNMVSYTRPWRVRVRCASTRGSNSKLLYRSFIDDYFCKAYKKTYFKEKKTKK